MDQRVIEAEQTLMRGRLQIHLDVAEKEYQRGRHEAAEEIRDRLNAAIRKPGALPKSELLTVVDRIVDQVAL